MSSESNKPRPRPLTSPRRRRAALEAALARSEAQYRMLFDEAADGILVLSKEGTLLDVNVKACTMTGRSREELLGQAISTLFPPEELAREALRFDLLDQGEEVFREREMLRRDGGRIVVEMHSRQTPAGAIHSIIRDATQRRLAERELSDREARLRSILRAAPTGIGVTVDRVLKEVNEKLCTMLGYTAAELVGHDARVLYPSQEEYELVGQEKYRQISESGAGTVETRWRRKDGVVLDILLSSTPIVAGELGAGVTFTALDITERKRAEAALRESEERYRGVYETAPIAFVLWDTGCRVTDWNRHAETIFGWSRSEVLGRDFFEFLIPAASRPKVAEVVVHLLRGELPSHSVNHNLTRDGRLILCDWYNAIRYDSHGQVAGVTSLGMDITERRTLEEQIQQTQRLESLGVLAGGIAHDFNNLLMAILGHADLARQALSPAAPGQQHLHEIVQASRRAADLCRQMLAYSGRGSFVVESIDLHALVNEMVHLLRTSISKKARLNLQLPAGLPPFEADPAQVRQIVMNLVLNASEALGDREGVIALSAHVRHCDRAFFRTTYLAEELTEGSYVCLEVADTGCGMDAQTRSRLFDPFFTTKFSGRGLGLAAVLGIVRSHRGALTVDSTPGQGSVFRVCFPAVTERPALARAAARVETVWDGGGATVLVVDDDESVLAVCTQMLTALGLRTLLAADGRAALEVYRAHGPEIACVLLDLTMPRMDGEEAFRAIRALDPRACVILSSGYSEQEVAERFSEVTPDGFIQKPYALDALRTALRDALYGSTPGTRQR